MRFGKTWQEKDKLRQEYLESIKDGKIVFAWLPVQLNDLDWAWLEYVKADYGVFKDCTGYFYADNSKPIYRPIA